MAIQQRKQSSIILTFKVLQFVRQLRRRVKPRVLEASIDANNLSTRKYPALRTISEGLSRISIQDAKHSRRLVNRICGTRRPRKLSRSSLRAQGSVTPANRNLARHKLQQYVHGRSCFVSSTKALGTTGCLGPSTASSLQQEAPSPPLLGTTSCFSNTIMGPSTRLAP
jgi:hypothetical protein